MGIMELYIASYLLAYTSQLHTVIGVQDYDSSATKHGGSNQTVCLIYDEWIMAYFAMTFFGCFVN